MQGWLEQDYSIWGGFELQYRDIKSKIIIEKLFDKVKDLEVYCFNGIPKIYRLIHNNEIRNVSVYDENFNNIYLKFLVEDVVLYNDFDKILNKTIDLSKKLSKDFLFVRVDYLISKNKFYFNELTFTTFSGFCAIDKKWNINLGNLINI